MRAKTRYIEQMEHSECGLACFAMVMNNYGFNINLPELRALLALPRKD